MQKDTIYTEWLTKKEIVGGGGGAHTKYLFNTASSAEKMTKFVKQK